MDLFCAGSSRTTQNSFLFPEAEIEMEQQSDDEESDDEEYELTADQVKKEIGIIKQIHPGQNYYHSLYQSNHYLSLLHFRNE